MTTGDRIAAGLDGWGPSDFILEGRFCPRPEVWSALDAARRDVGASAGLLLVSDELKILTSLSRAVPEDDHRVRGFGALIERMASSSESSPSTSIQRHLSVTTGDDRDDEPRFPHRASAALSGLAAVARQGGDEATASWLELAPDRWLPLWPPDAVRSARFSTAVLFLDPAREHTEEIQEVACVRADGHAVGLAERISGTARANVRRDVLIMKRLDACLDLRLFVAGDIDFSAAAASLVELAVEISGSDLGCCYLINPAERRFDLVAPKHLTPPADGWMYEQELPQDAQVLAAASCREHQTLGLPPGLQRLPELDYTGQRVVASRGSVSELATPLPGPLASPSAPAIGALSVTRLGDSHHPYGAYEISVLRNVALRLALISTTTTTTKAARMFVRLSLSGPALPAPASHGHDDQNGSAGKDHRLRPSAVPDDIRAALPAVEDALGTLGRVTASHSATFRVALPDASSKAAHGNALVRVAAHPPGLMSKTEHRVERADRGGINWQVALDGKFVNEPDVGAAVDYVAHHPETRSQLCVPVYVEGRVIGIVNLESPALHAYDAWIDIAQATAAHIGLAVANARLALATLIQEQAKELLRRTHDLKRYRESLDDVAKRVDPDAALKIKAISGQLERDVDHLLEPLPDEGTVGEFLSFPEIVTKALERTQMNKDFPLKRFVDDAVQWAMHPPEVATLLLKALTDVLNNAREHRKENTRLELRATQTRWGGEMQQVLCLRSTAASVPEESLAVNAYRCPYPSEDGEPHVGAYLAGLHVRRVGGEITLVYSEDCDVRVLVSIPAPETADASTPHPEGTGGGS